MSIIQEQPATTKANPGHGEGNLLATVPDTLTAAGYSPEAVAKVRQILAGGIVYGSFAAEVAAQNNRDLLPVTGMLGEIITRVADQQPLKPLVDMIKREQAKEQQAEPGHYPSCFGKCVLQRFEDGTTYYEHVGPTVEITIDDPHGGTIVLNAELGSDDALVDNRPTVFLRARVDDGLMFNAAQLDEAIADFERFTDGLRRLRQLMGQEKAQ